MLAAMHNSSIELTWPAPFSSQHFLTQGAETASFFATLFRSEIVVLYYFIETVQATICIWKASAQYPDKVNTLHKDKLCSAVMRTVVLTSSVKECTVPIASQNYFNLHVLSSHITLEQGWGTRGLKATCGLLGP
jgi:hypothetical protein